MKYNKNKKKYNGKIKCSQSCKISKAYVHVPHQEDMENVMIK